MSGILTQGDGNALMRYCRTLAQWTQAQQWLIEKGTKFPIRNKAGKIIRFETFPEVKAAAQMMEQILKLEKEFGLTPAARAGFISKGVQHLGGSKNEATGRGYEAEEPDAQFFGD